MVVDLYSQSGDKLDKKVELDPSIFAIEPNPDLVAQYARVYLANQRQGAAATKTRGDVSGGGKKPWRQKGTGRARHGSIRSPIWVGGGVSHGPQPKDWSLKMPKKMRRKALFSTLSQKAKDKKIVVLEKLALKEFKTKKIVELLSKIKVEGKILLILSKVDEKVIKSAENILGVKTIQAKDLNAYVVLNSDWVVVEKDGLRVMEEAFLRNQK